VSIPRREREVDSALVDDRRSLFGSLQSVVEELVHLGDASGDAEVNGTVTDLNNESTNNVGVDLNASC
jgi:hypothetical protein